MRQDTPRPLSQNSRGPTRDSSKKPTALRIAQCNVGKRSPANTALLQLCHEEKIDVVLAQEPWSSHGERLLLNTHPGYDTFSPVDFWEDNESRPRVLTYVRKGLKAQQTRPSASRDLLWISMQGITIVNVYRPQGNSGDDQTTTTLLEYQPPPNSVVGGDFNSRHPIWEPQSQPTSAGKAIAHWTDLHNLRYIGEIGIPTQDRGHVLDLTFSNIPSATAEVHPALHPGADHEALLVVIPLIPLPSCETTTRAIIPDGHIERFVSLVQLCHPQPVQPGASVIELDQGAEDILECLSAAVQATKSTPKGGQKRAPWWTPECVRSRADFHRARRIQAIICSGHTDESNCQHCVNAATARADFHQTVRSAKQEYWNKRISDAATPADLFRITKWRNSTLPIRPPALVVDGISIEDTESKATALRSALLERFSPEDDIEATAAFSTPVVPKAAIPWDTKVSAREARAATLTRSTTPGADGITVRLLQAAWNALEEPVRALFEGCLTQGHFPHAFKNAEVVFIQKPGKKDRSNPGSFRPISLLSCLGKGLERLFARRVAYAAIKAGIMNPQQFGALPGRSAADLAACVTHDIEMALQQGLTATLVTMDVKGAFDAALRNRFILRLRQQGWPEAMFQLVYSFMTSRTAQIRMEGSVLPQFPLSCGLPQGSPASPVLFLLYISEALLENPLRRFGYADDFGLLAISSSLEENARILGEEIDHLREWGDANKVTFDEAKTEAIHFTRQQRQNWPAAWPAITTAGSRIQPVSHDKSIRWLGIHFDRTLSFRSHVSHRAASAQNTAQFLRGLGSIYRGLPSALARQAAVTCVLPSALFGAEVWYSPGSGQQWHLQQIDRVFRTALRAVLPVWSTTPAESLYREGGIPPAAVALRGHQLGFSARLGRLDYAHPLVRRLTEPALRGSSPTRLQRAYKLLPQCPRPLLIEPRPPGPPLRPKEETAQAFQRWAKTRPLSEVFAYSDGSRLRDGSVGYGYSICYGSKTIAKGRGRLGTAEVVDAEAEGARWALRNAMRLRPFPATVHLCLDNSSVVQALQGHGKTPTSSQAAILEVREARQFTDVRAHWIPGHLGIPGNELADKLAKEGAALPLPHPSPLATVAGIARAAKTKAANLFTSWWEGSERSITYAYGLLDARTGCPPELQLPRKSLHRLLAARSGHGDFTAYHQRFNHPGDHRCVCGRDKSRSHPAHCRKIQHSKAAWPVPKIKGEDGPLPSAPAEQYWRALVQDPVAFSRFEKVTGYFDLF